MNEGLGKLLDGTKVDGDPLGETWDAESLTGPLGRMWDEETTGELLGVAWDDGITDEPLGETGYEIIE